MKHSPWTAYFFVQFYIWVSGLIKNCLRAWNRALNCEIASIPKSSKMRFCEFFFAGPSCATKRHMKISRGAHGKSTSSDFIKIDFQTEDKEPWSSGKLFTTWRLFLRKTLSVLGALIRPQGNTASKHLTLFFQVDSGVEHHSGDAWQLPTWTVFCHFATNYM